MRQIAIGIGAGLVAAIALFASLNPEAFKATQAVAQTATSKGPSDCSSTSSSQIITQVTSSTPGKVLGFFVCIADLDGTGKQQVVVGRYAEAGGSLSIFTNNGTLRKQVDF